MLPVLGLLWLRRRRPVRSERAGLTDAVLQVPGEVPADFGPSAVTIGKFDGVHAGHRAVIGELLAVAEPLGWCRRW